MTACSSEDVRVWVREHLYPYIYENRRSRGWKLIDYIKEQSRVILSDSDKEKVMRAYVTYAIHHLNQRNLGSLSDRELCEHHIERLARGVWEGVRYDFGSEPPPLKDLVALAISDLNWLSVNWCIEKEIAIRYGFNGEGRQHQTLGELVADCNGILLKACGWYAEKRPGTPIPNWRLREYRIYTYERVAEVVNPLNRRLAQELDAELAAKRWQW